MHHQINLVSFHIFILTILHFYTTKQKHKYIRMQDKDVEPDEDLCVKVNLYLSDSSEAASAAGASTTDGGASDGDDAGTGGNNGMDNAELLRIMQGALGQESGARVGTVPGSNSIPSAGAGQVRYIY